MNYDKLIRKLKKHIKTGEKSLGSATISVSFRDLHSDDSFDINGDHIGWAASVIKVPIMVAVYNEVLNNNLKLTDKIMVDHRLALDGGKVSEVKAGTYLPVGILMAYMIGESDNEATNLLARKIGIENINTLRENLGMEYTRMSHLLHKGADIVYEGVKGDNSNTTTANEMTGLFSKIYKNSIFDNSSCRDMKSLLENNISHKFNKSNFLDFFLPKNTIIGNKVGLIDEDLNDIGVINRDYALGIMINHINRNGYASFFQDEDEDWVPRDEKLASLDFMPEIIIGRISREVYTSYY